MQALCGELERGLSARCGAIINGTGSRICNTLNASFPGMDGETLLIQLDQAGIASSHGSACSAGAMEPSRILLNMGLSHERVRSSLRFSLSRYTTQEEIAYTIETAAALACSSLL
jgi:cysteine desulfurase